MEPQVCLEHPVKMVSVAPLVFKDLVVPLAHLAHPVNPELLELLVSAHPVKMVSAELLVFPVPLVKMVSAELLVPLDLLEDPVALEPPAKMVSMELLVPLALKVIVELLDSTEDLVLLVPLVRQADSLDP